MSKTRRQGQLNKRCRETADAGFSLIELLIAVTILAIIVIPLLHMFVTSTRINVKARQTLRATTVAQDIMEGLKAYTLEEVSAQFEPPEGVSGSGYHYPSDGFYIVNSSLIQGGVRDLTKDMAGHVDGDEIYYFGIENLKLQGGEYDALIKLDASTYGEDRDKTSSPHDNQFNGQFYAEIGNVAEVSGSSDEATKATDSSYHESKKLAEAVIEFAKQDFETQIMTAGGTLPADWDEKWKGYKIENVVTRRDIEVEIDDAGAKDAEGNEQCKATINFTYECRCPYSGYSYTCTIYGGPESLAVPAKANISRTFSSGNFYLFYYPIYKTPVVDNIKFVINNESKLLDEKNPLLKQIVIAKQIRSDVDTANNIIIPDLPITGPDGLLAKERVYAPNIHFLVGDAKKLILKTNLNTNLADGSEISSAHVPYNVNIICSITGDNASDKVTNVIYDIEIKVYKTGAAQHFTQANFEDNDDVQRLAIITNMNQ